MLQFISYLDIVNKLNDSFDRWFVNYLLLFFPTYVVQYLLCYASITLDEREIESRFLNRFHFSYDTIIAVANIFDVKIFQRSIRYRFATENNRLLHEWAVQVHKRYLIVRYVADRTIFVIPSNNVQKSVRRLLEPHLTLGLRNLSIWARELARQLDNFMSKITKNWTIIFVHFIPIIMNGTIPNIYSNVFLFQLCNFQTLHDVNILNRNKRLFFFFFFFHVIICMVTDVKVVKKYHLQKNYLHKIQLSLASFEGTRKSCRN